MADEHPAHSDRSRAVVRGRALVALVLLLGLAAAALGRAYEGPQGSAYWRAEPAGAVGWLAGVVAVTAAATVALRRVPTRESRNLRLVAAAVFAGLIAFLGLQATPLL